MAKKNEENALFETVKKGYDPAAVDEYITKMKAEYESKIAEMTEKYETLRDKNDELKENLLALQSQKSEVASILINAEATSANIIEQARKTAEEECLRLDGEIEQRKRIVVNENEEIRKLRIDSSAAFDEYAELYATAIEKIKIEADVLVERMNASLRDVKKKFAETTDLLCK